MAGFRGNRYVLLSVPEKNSFSKASARGDDNLCRFGIWLTRINHFEVGRFHHTDAVRGGLQIVQQTHAAQLEEPGQRSAVDHPWQVRSANRIVDHRPSDSEGSGSDFSPVRAEKVVGDVLQTGIFVAGV